MYCKANGGDFIKLRHLEYNGPPSSLPNFLIGVPSPLTCSDSSADPPDSTDRNGTDEKPPQETGDQKPPRESDEQKPKWVLTPEAFEKLLMRFSTDREEAGVQYEIARQKVIRFFEWNSVEFAAEYADEVLNRVARRIDEGQTIDNLVAYTLGVARVVLKEIRKHLDRRPIGLDDAPPDRLEQKVPEPIEPDARQICFDRCLENVPAGNRKLLLDYYQFEGGAKIKHRRELAAKMGIPLNALRIRVHRIRKTFENCIADCLKNSQPRND